MSLKDLLSMEIGPGASGSGKKPQKSSTGARGKGKYPTKTSINLVFHENNGKRIAFDLVVFGIFLVALGIFTKFMVLDKLNEINTAQAEYGAKQEQLKELVSSNSVYDDVSGQYSHYGTGYMNSDELAMQDRAKMMQVIDQDVQVDSGIKSISITGNTATLTIERTTLSEVSDVVQALQSSDIVQYVSPSTASTGDDSTDTGVVTAEITITFTSPTGAVSSSSGDGEPSLTDQLAAKKQEAESEGMENQ
ncbi:hypothetical protein [Bilifractor sp. HCP3S3_D3]|uniref:hypothetical protein n=1 Tax=unclassified Bilifractor TaxID=2815795 RepID=UPI003F8BDB5C